MIPFVLAVCLAAAPAVPSSIVVADPVCLGASDAACVALPVLLRSRLAIAGLTVLSGNPEPALFAVIVSVVLIVLDEAGMIEPGWESRIGGNLFVTIVRAIFNSIVAGTITESIAGTSLGKFVLGYRVVSLEPLEPCRPRAALIRSAAYFVDSLFFGIIAIIAMQDSTLHQRMGDSWAGTAVAKSSALPPEAKRGFGLVALGILAGFVVSGLLAVAPMFLRGIL